jgi:hypothetical protein
MSGCGAMILPTDCKDWSGGNSVTCKRYKAAKTFPTLAPKVFEIGFELALR